MHSCHTDCVSLYLWQQIPLACLFLSAIRPHDMSGSGITLDMSSSHHRSTAVRSLSTASSSPIRSCYDDARPVSPCRMLSTATNVRYHGDTSLLIDRADRYDSHVWSTTCSSSSGSSSPDHGHPLATLGPSGPRHPLDLYICHMPRLHLMGESQIAQQALQMRLFLLKEGRDRRLDSQRR